jgi:ribosomal protein S8
MITLYGVHGTTASCADKIEQEGFKSSQGYRGEGIYFWRKNVYAEDLVIGWYLTSISQGHHSKDTDKRCAIISASINVDDDEFVSLESPNIKDNIAALFKQSNYKDHINAIKFYEEFFELLELELNHPVKVVEIAFPAPKKCQVYPRQALGMPIAYLVREANCVSILSIKKLEKPEIESWKTANESMKQLKKSLPNYSQ